MDLLRTSMWPGYRRAWSHLSEPAPSFEEPISQPVTSAQFLSADLLEWTEAIHHTPTTHRKLWEYCFVLQCLRSAGALRPGARGLGFAVGVEPIASLLASRGCQIVATDIPTGVAESEHWLSAAQRSRSYEELNRWGICDPTVFGDLVTFREVDMRAIPDDLSNFDFTWSCCAFEHLGTIEAGLRFIEAQLRCLKPGGIAVHTTELNVSSDRSTVEEGIDVLFRRSDIARLAATLRSQGHAITTTFNAGAAKDDRHIDFPPYRQDVHLKLFSQGYITTSFGVVITRGPETAATSSSQMPDDRTKNSSQ